MSDNTNELVQAILEVTAPITQMLDHMMRAPGEPALDDVVMTMKRLLEDVLEPLETDHDLAAATVVLDAALPLIIDGIFFVPHPNRSERRHPPRRRHQRH